MDSVRPDFRRVILGGVAATLVLTALMYLAPLADFPNIDMASAIGGFLDRPALVFTARWWIGLAVFVLVGVLLAPLLFAWAAPRILYGRPWLRGLEYGALLWAFGAVFVMVHFGLMFHEPFTSQPHLSALSSFSGNLAYGAVLAIVGARLGPVLKPGLPT